MSMASGEVTAVEGEGATEYVRGKLPWEDQYKEQASYLTPAHLCPLARQPQTRHTFKTSMQQPVQRD